MFKRNMLDWLIFADCSGDVGAGECLRGIYERTDDETKEQQSRWHPEAQTRQGTPAAIIMSVDTRFAPILLRGYPSAPLAPNSLPSFPPSTLFFS